MLVNVSLLEFLKTGSLGGIELGITRQQVLQFLGEPPDWSISRRNKLWQTASVWRYGSIEFSFADQSNALRMIYSDHFPLEGSTTLQLDTWIFDEGLSLQEVLRQVTQVNLKAQWANQGAEKGVG